MTEFYQQYRTPPPPLGGNISPRALQLDSNLPQELAIEFEGILIDVSEQFGDIETVIHWMTFITHKV